MTSRIYQYDRRDASNIDRVHNVSLSPSLIRSTLNSRRRYVLEEPAGVTTRTIRSRPADATIYPPVTTRDIYRDTGAPLSHSNSNKSFYRNGTGDQSSFGLDHLMSAVDDQQVEILFPKPRSNTRRYPINVDTNRQPIVRPNTQVQYPKSKPIIVRDIESSPLSHGSLISFQARPPRPRTPSSVIIRDKFPVNPNSAPTTIVTKIIPPPAPPHRKWIIERSAESPSVEINEQQTYSQRSYPQYRDHLHTTQFVPRKSQQSRITKERSLIKQQQYVSVAQEEADIQQNNIRQIHDSVKQDHVRKNALIRIWFLFSAKEKVNILIYIIGIMLYKFGLEAFNGSLVTLATNRYDQDAFKEGISPRTFEKVGLLSGLNQAFQCIGSILIAPLVQRFPSRIVLSISVFIFGLFTAILMIIDASSGGRIKPTNFQPAHENDFSYYGSYNTNLIIPIYSITGIVYGMVELIRRIIPRDIVGDDAEKLQRMDALVHIFYEVAGVSGAFATGLGLIPRLGNNYAFIITPILFTAAAIVWSFIRILGIKSTSSEDEIAPSEGNSKSNCLKSLIEGFVLFGQSVYLGGKLLFTNRKWIWLWPCYSLTLYAHRYLENGIAPQVARRYLGNSAWSQIIVGGSNFGELLGALSVFILTNLIKSPIPWLRIDALLLLLTWFIPYWNPPSGNLKYAWILAAIFIPFGFGAASDDVSLSAYIQSSLSVTELNNKNVSSLGAVTAFLYSSYIITYAIANPLLGKYIDKVFNSRGTVRPALVYTVAVQMTMISVIVFVSTFIPKGAIAFNPLLNNGK